MLVMVPVLAAAMGAGAAQAQPGRNPGHGNQGYHANNGNHGNHGNPNDFHFRDQDRGHFAVHYRSDINRWRRRPQARPHFVRGQRIPNNYRLRVVPQAYYASVPPPPPGYQYGYYDGYVVAYDPTTRIIADVLDLVTAATVR
jgi:Ni/Co efflux regulator RcnB